MRKDIEEAIALSKTIKGTTTLGQGNAIKAIESKLMPDEIAKLAFSANANYYPTNKKGVNAFSLTSKKSGLFVITNKRIIHLSKVLLKEEIQQIMLNQIVAVNTKSSTLGAFGSLCIDTANNTFEVDMAPTACNLCIQIINELSAQPTKNQTINPLEQIEKLSELKEKGIISEEEFQLKKSELLKLV